MGHLGRMRKGLQGLLIVALVVATGAVALIRAGAGDSPVAAAVKAGDLDGVRKLIASKADVNLAGSDGSTALLWAAYGSDVEAARILVAAGAKPDIANRFGVTPLIQASRTGDAVLVKVLLDGGANPKLAHPEGETPLMAASRSGNPEAVQVLLARGSDVNAAELFQQETALMWAAAEGHATAIDALIAAGADPNRKARVTSLTERKNADHPTGGFTALMWAARNGHEAALRSLAKGKADLNLTNGDNATAMNIAIYNDRFDIAAVLVELGADVNDGSLYHAVEMRDATTDWYAHDGSQLRANHPNKLTALDLIKLLLDKGADPNRSFSGLFHSTSMPNNDRFDNSPFFRAAVASDVEALKVLVASGKVDLEKTPPVPAPPAEGAAPPAGAAAGGRGRGNANAGRTAIMVTMTGGRGPGLSAGPGYTREGAPPWREPGSREPLKAFEFLLNAGANPNAKAGDGNTLLHQVAQAGNVDMIKLLASHKVDFNQKNNGGLTALDVAEGKVPEGARGGAAARGGPRGAAPPPPAGGARGRGARGGASQQDVAKLLRELMGLPPAPPSAAPANPPTDQAAPANDAAATPADGDVQ
jgi:uncharacterized protein